MSSSSSAPPPLVGAAKRKRKGGNGNGNTSASAATLGSSAGDRNGGEEEQEEKRPRVHAQRKFAQGQGSATSSPAKSTEVPRSVVASSSGRSRAQAQAALELQHQSHSSSSSTASGPTSAAASASRDPNAAAASAGERPKTEDFLTFLCLRGTNLLPPELDFFNKASVVPQNNESSDDISSDDDKVSGAVAKKTVRRSSLPSTSSAASSSVAKRVNANGDPKNNGGLGVKRQLPAAMQALKKKYADQRLAKKVVSKALPPPQRATRSTRATEKKQQKKGRDAEKRETEQQRQAQHTRSTRSSQQQRGRRRIKSPVGGINLTLGRKPPSAATLVAKRKTRMATLTAASSSVSRMLTRLTPRGTSSAAFVRSTKKINLERRSLRGREISVSSDEESEDEEVSLKVSSAKAGGKASPPKRKLKSREEKDKLQKKSHRRPYSESEADEETSSRDSSRKPPPLHHRHRQQLPLSKSSSKLNLDPRVVLNKRDVRSLSRDSSGSGSTTNSSSRPSRKTKEAASVYLNVLGHKLLKKRSEQDEDDEDEDDNISIDSLNESTQEKRLEALKAKKKSAKAGKPRKAADEDASGTTDSEKGGDRKKGSKERKKLKSSACSLKQLQDKLLEEAKMKIGTPPPAPAPVLKTKSTEQNQMEPARADERITISQKTGYIQIKKRSASVDQHPIGAALAPAAPVKEIRPPVPLPVPAPAVVAAVPIGGTVPVLIGPNGRRLSQNGANDQRRTSTPPRKILPKSDAPEKGAVAAAAQVAATAAVSSHLPLGVMGASRLSQPVSMKPNAGSPQTPLTQPLVINTGSPKTNKALPPVTAPNRPQQQQQLLRLPSATTVTTTNPRPQGATVPIVNSVGGGVPILPRQQQTTSSGSAAAKANNPQQSNAKQISEAKGQIPSAQMPQQQPNRGNPHQPVPPQQQQQQQQPPRSYQQPQQLPMGGGGYPKQQMPMQGGGGGFPPQQQQQPGYQQQQHQYLHAGQQQYAQPYGQVHPQQQQYSNPQPQQSQMYQQPYRPQQQAVNLLHQQQQQYQHQQRLKQQQLQQQLVEQQQQRIRQQQQQQQQQSSSHRASASAPTSAKSKSIFSSPAKAAAAAAEGSRGTAGAASFKVDNEASPYAFDDPEPTSSSSVPYGRKAASTAVQTKATPTSKQEKKAKKKDRPAGAAASASSPPSSAAAGDSNIPIPEELAKQLKAQAKKEAASSSGGASETTYFIPLQSGGSSFGVSVKLSTEGPPGPNQKVIMTAKLVTQPTGKPIGAKVIGAKALQETKVTGPAAGAAKSGGKKFSRMPMASPASPTAAATASSTDEDSSSSDGGGDTSDSSMTSPRSKKSRKGRRREAGGGDDHSQPHPESCLGPVEVLERFPKLGQHAKLVEAPVFRPSEREFRDPMKYIARIRRVAEPFGVCKIIPPSSFKPECNVDDDMRFVPYNQYVQKMMNRWGPNSKEMAAMSKYLETQNVTMKQHPAVGGIEIDFPALYHAVQSFGGLTEVIQRKRWGKIAEYLRIPKGTQDPGKKLDDIYCKYILPYDTLSPVERDELLRLVEEEHEEANKRKLERSRNEGDSDEEDEEEEEDEEDECVVKGKSTSLSQFYRLGGKVMGMIFKHATEAAPPEPREVEEEFWKLVIDRDSHVVVHQGSIDTGMDEGFGFPTSRASSCGRHAWNLKILSNNPGSVLRCLGPVVGVTVPTLHVGMVFTTGCWYRDPHGLPSVEYHHTGAPKIWYSIPESHGIAFYTAMKQLVPTFCRKKNVWLPTDTTMVPPNLLVKHGVSVTRTVQQPGQFLVEFPRSYTSSVCTGYSLSESVFFAPPDYVDSAGTEFQNIRESAEPMMFPLAKLLVYIAEHEETSRAVLKKVKPHIERIRDNEYVKRAMIGDLGVKGVERIVLKAKKPQQQDDEYECEVCSENLYISFVHDVKEDTYYCLEHAIEYLQERKASQRKHCKLLYTHSKEEVSAIVKMVNARIEDTEESTSESSSEEDEETEVRRYYEKKPSSTAPSSSSSSTAAALAAAAAAAAAGLSTSGKTKAAVMKKREDLLSLPKKEEKAVKKKVETSKKDQKPSPKESKKPKKEAKPEVPKRRKKAESEENEDEDEEERPLKKKPKAKEPPAKAKEAPAKAAKEPAAAKATRAGSSRQGGSAGGRRKTKTRKAALDKSGNLASEILDMMLGGDSDESGEDEEGSDSSDEAWK